MLCSKRVPFSSHVEIPEEFLTKSTNSAYVRVSGRPYLKRNWVFTIENPIHEYDWETRRWNRPIKWKRIYRGVREIAGTFVYVEQVIRRDSTFGDRDVLRLFNKADVETARRSVARAYRRVRSLFARYGRCRLDTSNAESLNSYNGR